MKNILVRMAASILPAVSFAYDIHTRALTPIVEDAVPQGAEMQFVRNGSLDFVIVADAKAEAKTGKVNRTEKSIGPAVALLADAFEKATGKRPAVVDVGDAERLEAARFWLVVGDCAIARRNGVDISKLPHAGFAVRTFPRGIVVAGWDSSLVAGYNSSKIDPRGAALGTFYGAVDFTERFLGCRYFFPGPHGSLHPRISDLAIRPVSYSDAPYFDLRDDPYYYHCTVRKSSYSGCPVNGDDQLARYRAALGDGMNGIWGFLRLWRQGSTNPQGGHHSPAPGAFLKAHPGCEKVIFYTSPNGKFWRNEQGHIGNYYNVWDLRFADLLVSSYTNYLATGDAKVAGTSRWNSKYLSFGVCDTYMNYQDCIDDPVVKELGLMTPSDIARGPDAAFSNIYGRFYQYLGNRLKEVAPSSRLYLLIYYNSRFASLDPRWKLPDNVEINYCASGMPLGVVSAKRVADTNKALEEWYVALGNRQAMRVWLYNNRHNQFVRAVCPEFIGKFIQSARKYLNREGGLFFDYDGGWDIWHHYYSAYAGLKSQWNPDFDVDAAIDEHWDAFYGPEAGAHLRRFHRVLKEGVTTSVKEGKKDVSPAVVDELEACLKAADACLQAGTVERIRFDLVSATWPRAFAQYRAIAAYVPPVHRVKRLSAPEPDASFWAGVPPVPMSDTKGGTTNAMFASRFRVAWSGKGIYVRFEADYEPAADPEKDFWANDCVEMFFSPGLGREVKHMIAFDATGRWYSEKERRLPIPQPSDNTWKPQGATLKVSRASGSWAADVFVPFSALECSVPAPGARWHFNGVRNKLSDPHETVGSALTNAQNHNVMRYGELVFE